MLLSGKTAFVTGGARGIGLAIAERYAEEGACVMLGDVRIEEGEESAAGLREAGHDASAVALDVTDEGSVEAAAQACWERYGGVDIVVANAGVLHLGPVVETPLADWERVIRVNLTGTFLTLKVFARRMVEGGTGGRIVVNSSIFGKRSGRENGAYSASKFGAVGLVEALAAEVAPHGILVNAVCPGQIATPMMHKLFEERGGLRGMAPGQVEAELVGRIPVGRLADAREIGDAFVFLASDLSRYVTGQSLVVDGGWQVGP